MKKKNYISEIYMAYHIFNKESASVLSVLVSDHDMLC